jgi:uncharacterized protein (TIGR02597 family)
VDLYLQYPPLLNHYNSMKNFLNYLAVLFGAALFASSHLAAESVSTNPVGYVTFTAADGVDAKFGITMERALLFTASIDSVTAGVLALSVDPSAATDGHYIQFTSGSLLGQWFQVVSSSSTTITVAEDLSALGATSSDSIKVVPFWTLSTLFGDGFPVSADPFSSVAQVLLNDVTALGINLPPNRNYAYHDGSSGFVAAGWYDVNNPFVGVQDDVIIAPNSFITVRNQSGEQLDSLVAGSVPSELNVVVVADASVANDNLVFNPYPVAIQLSSSALESVVAVSPDPFSPADQVIVYGTPTGLNPAPEFNYAYHDGSSGFVPAGWYDVNNPFNGSQDSVSIPAGGAFLIRKGPGSTSGNWVATIPYSL